MKTDRIRDEDVPHITIAENEARHAEKHLFNGVKLAHRPRLLFALENLERVHVIFVQALVLAQLLVSLVVPYETS